MRRLPLCKLASALRICYESCIRTSDEEGVMGTESKGFDHASADRATGVGRRAFLTASAGAAAASVVMPTAAWSHNGVEAPPEWSGESNWFVGVIGEVSAADRALVAIEGLGPTQVQTTPDAQVLRDEITDLMAFAEGETVSLRGQQQPDGTFLATAFEAVYEMTEATILRRKGDSLETDKGTFELGAATKHVPGAAFGHTLAVRSDHRLRAGDVVVAHGRLDPASGNLLVRRIGLVDH